MPAKKSTKKKSKTTSKATKQHGIHTISFSTPTSIMAVSAVVFLSFTVGFMSSSQVASVSMIEGQQAAVATVSGQYEARLASTMDKVERLQIQNDQLIAEIAMMEMQPTTEDLGNSQVLLERFLIEVEDADVSLPQDTINALREMVREQQESNEDSAEAEQDAS